MKSFLKDALNIVRFAEQNRALLLRTAAERYRDFLVNRFRSGGAGSWEPLAPSTIRSKKSRGAKRPEAILREFDQLFTSIEIEETEEGTEVGYINDAAHRRGRSLLEVVEFHHETGKVLRPIIVEPSVSTKERMIADIRKTYYREYRKRRRG